MDGDLCIRAVGDSAVLVEFPTLGPDDAWSRVRALDAALDVGFITELCPALVNLLVVFDPLVTDHDEVAAVIKMSQAAPASVLNPDNHRVEIIYNRSAHGDLATLSATVGLGINEVIALHIGASYEVRMFGFAPGYAYLGGLPKAIQVPRKPVPVRTVPAGSVVIANDQCLITTFAMPTGWWVIGTSPTPVLDPGADRPTFFEVGDRVHFFSTENIIT